MKTIELKCAKEFIDAAEQEILLSTVGCIKIVLDQKAVLQQRTQGGCDYELMTSILNLYKAIRPHIKEFSMNGYKSLVEMPPEFFDKTATIEIEDEDYTALASWVTSKETKWNFPAQFFVDFVNSFK